MGGVLRGGIGVGEHTRDQDLRDRQLLDRSRHDPHLLICDDHRMYAEVIRDILVGEGFHTVTICTEPESALETVTTTPVSLVLMDVHIPGHDTVGTIVDMAALGLCTRVILMSGVDPEPDAVWPRNVVGFIRKGESTTTFLESIARALQPPSTASVPETTRGFDRCLRAEDRCARWHLTPRERETLQGLVQGLSTSELAARLGVRQSTVRGYVQSVLYKLGVSSRLAAAALAAEAGMVPTTNA